MSCSIFWLRRVYRRAMLREYWLTVGGLHTPNGVTRSAVRFTESIGLLADPRGRGDRGSITEHATVVGHVLDHGGAVVAVCTVAHLCRHGK